MCFAGTLMQKKLYATYVATAKAKKRNSSPAAPIWSKGKRKPRRIELGDVGTIDIFYFPFGLEVIGCRYAGIQRNPRLLG
jgi:hypothetical protein